MSLRADIQSVIESFDQHDGQDVTNVRIVMIDCQQCSYSDSFTDIDEAELFLRGHIFVSRHTDIDIGVEMDMMLQSVDCTIRVGNTIES